MKKSSELGRKLLIAGTTAAVILSQVADAVAPSVEKVGSALKPPRVSMEKIGFSSPYCNGFFDVADIAYLPVYWDNDKQLFQSFFRQEKSPGEVGYVEEVNYMNGLVIFPMGANVTGYRDSTTEKKVTLPDGSQISFFKTCYVAK